MMNIKLACFILIMIPKKWNWPFWCINVIYYVYLLICTTPMTSDFAGRICKYNFAWQRLIHEFCWHLPLFPAPPPLPPPPTRLAIPLTRPCSNTPFCLSWHLCMATTASGCSWPTWLGRCYGVLEGALAWAWGPRGVWSSPLAVLPGSLRSCIV